MNVNNLADTQSAREMGVKAMFYGKPGSGKTVLALQAPKPVAVLDLEPGVHWALNAKDDEGNTIATGIRKAMGFTERRVKRIKLCYQCHYTAQLSEKEPVFCARQSPDKGVVITRAALFLTLIVKYPAFSLLAIFSSFSLFLGFLQQVWLPEILALLDLLSFFRVLFLYIFLITITIIFFFRFFFLFFCKRQINYR